MSVPLFVPCVNARSLVKIHAMHMYKFTDQNVVVLGVVVVMVVACGALGVEFADIKQPDHVPA